MVLSQQEFRWPWLVELGLLNAVLSVFTPLEKVPVDPIPKQVYPWMYLNVVMDRVQLALPLGEEVLRTHDRMAQARLLVPSRLTAPNHHFTQAGPAGAAEHGEPHQGGARERWPQRLQPICTTAAAHTFAPSAHAGRGGQRPGTHTALVVWVAGARSDEE